jgi:hypothetical protein
MKDAIPVVSQDEIVLIEAQSLEEDDLERQTFSTAPTT